MTATPQFGTLVATGLESKKSYTVDMYVSDVVNANVNFDSGMGASSTSDNYYTFPEQVIITDLIMEAAVADAPKMRLTSNGKPTEFVLRHKVNHLASVQQRPALHICVNAGSRLSAVQLA